MICLFPAVLRLVRPQLATGWTIPLLPPVSSSCPRDVRVCARLWRTARLGGVLSCDSYALADVLLPPAAFASVLHRVSIHRFLYSSSTSQAVVLSSQLRECRTTLRELYVLGPLHRQQGLGPSMPRSE